MMNSLLQIAGVGTLVVLVSTLIVFAVVYLRRNSITVLPMVLLGFILGCAGATVFVAALFLNRSDETKGQCATVSEEKHAQEVKKFEQYDKNTFK